MRWPVLCVWWCWCFCCATVHSFRTCDATLCCAGLGCAVLCYAVLCCAVLCCAVLCPLCCADAHWLCCAVLMLTGYAVLCYAVLQCLRIACCLHKSFQLSVLCIWWICEACPATSLCSCMLAPTFHHIHPTYLGLHKTSMARPHFVITRHLHAHCGT